VYSHRARSGGILLVSPPEPAGDSQEVSRVSLSWLNKDLVPLAGVLAAGATAIPLTLTALAVFFSSLISLAMPASRREHALLVLDRLSAFADAVRGRPTAALDESSGRPAETAAGPGQLPNTRPH